MVAFKTAFLAVMLLALFSLDLAMARRHRYRTRSWSQRKVARRSQVIQIGMGQSDRFDRIISKGYTFVAFSAEWCGHCVRLAPIFQSAAVSAAKQRPPVTLVRVECQNGRNKPRNPICDRYDIHSFPTIKMFNDGRVFQEYTGGRTERDITNYLASIVGYDHRRTESRRTRHRGSKKCSRRSQFQRDLPSHLQQVGYNSARQAQHIEASAHSNMMRKKQLANTYAADRLKALQAKIERIKAKRERQHMKAEYEHAKALQKASDLRKQAAKAHERATELRSKMAAERRELERKKASQANAAAFQHHVNHIQKKMTHVMQAVKNLRHAMDKMMGKTPLRFIKFCGKKDCSGINEKWGRVADIYKSMGDLVNFGEVNCDTSPNLCPSGMRTPAFQMFSADSDDGVRYSSEPTVKGLNGFVHDSIEGYKRKRK